MSEKTLHVLFTSLIVIVLFARLLNMEDQNIKIVKNDISVIFPEVKRLRVYTGNNSRVINKRDIYLKVYNSNGEPYDKNTLIYVCLHEIAHIICTENDTSETTHSAEFYKIFDKLIDISIDKRVFNPSIPLDKDFLETK